MSARKRRWTVGRTWWELTKFILLGGARFDLYLRVDDLPTAAQNEFNQENWCPVELHWEDSRDHFAILRAEAEFGSGR